LPLVEGAKAAEEARTPAGISVKWLSAGTVPKIRRSGKSAESGFQATAPARYQQMNEAAGGGRRFACAGTADDFVVAPEIR